MDYLTFTLTLLCVFGKDVCGNMSDGPFKATIIGPNFIDKSLLGKIIPLYCDVDDVYPNTTYSWTVSGTSSYLKYRCSSGSTCTLTPTLEDDGKNVTCTATNERDVTISAFDTYQIRIAYGPYNVSILGSLSINKSQLGRNVILNCTFDDVFPNISYTWFWKYDWHPTSHTCYTSSTCTFVPQIQDNGKIVTCYVTNTRHSSYWRSSEYKINIIYGPLNISIIGPPFINKTHLGKTVTLYCSADDVFPSVSFSWYWSYNWHRACNRNNTCTFYPQKRDDGNTVTCVVTNTRDTSKRMTTQYKINVAYGPFQATISGPTFIDKSQLGKNIPLYCDVDDVYPSTTFSWTVSGTSSSLKYRCSSGSTCTLTPTLEDDGNNVTCTATNERDVTIRAFDNYQIRIAYGPYNVSILGSPSFNKSQLGMNVFLNCTFDDVFPNVSYKWFWKDYRHPTSHTCNTSSTCTFVPQIQDDGKIVTCVVTNTRDPSNWNSSDYKINIVYGPFNANVSGPSFINKTQLGTDLVLSCAIDDVYPRAVYSWTVNGTSLTTPECSSNITCSLRPILQDDGKNVTCIATNERDVSRLAVQTYQINVAYGPDNVSISGPEYIEEGQLGQEVSLKCTANGAYPNVTYSWTWGSDYYSRQRNISGDTYQLPPNQTVDGMIVTCTANNTRDTSKSAMKEYKIKIVYKPNYLIVGVAVGASIITILAIIIVVVIIIKKKKVHNTKSASISWQFSGKNFSDCVEHVNQLYRAWEQIPTTLSATNMINQKITSFLPPTGDIYTEVN